MGKAYGELVRELRRVAGGAPRDARSAEPITKDSDMNIGADLELEDLSSLTRLEKAYTDAVEAAPRGLPQARHRLLAKALADTAEGPASVSRRRVRVA